MVLNQNEYTMTSLGFNYQKPPLFLPNQTRPPSFPYMFQPTPPPLNCDLSLFSPRTPSPEAAEGGGASRRRCGWPSLANNPKPIFCLTPSLPLFVFSALHPFRRCPPSSLARTAVFGDGETSEASNKLW